MADPLERRLPLLRLERRELELVAERSGWEIVEAYEDAGISGAKGRDKRPGLDAMMKAVNAKEFDMVAAWSVDRLGRSLTDLLAILQSLQDKGVDLFLHQSVTWTGLGTAPGRCGPSHQPAKIHSRRLANASAGCVGCDGSQ